jgi:hypothetical protein
MDSHEQNVLASVFKGMEVFDADGKKVGTVDFVYMGSVHGRGEGTGAATEPTPPTTPETGLVGNIARTVDPAEDLPDELKSRLLSEGYVRVDNSRLFSADRFVLPGQINSVDGNRVLLNARYPDLPKR